MTPKERAAMQQALEVLEQHVEHFDYEHFTSVCELDPAKDTILALREMLAGDNMTPTEQASVRTKDLTDDEIINLLPAGEWEIDSTLAFASAVIAADREKNK